MENEKDKKDKEKTGAEMGDFYSRKELSKPVPDNFKMGRDASIQLSKVRRDLFTDIEEKESGKPIVKGLAGEVSELDFEAFGLAMAQTLYNQSYIFGHTEKNTGIKENLIPKNESIRGDLYRGEIVVTLNDICRLGYGVDTPTTEQKRDMDKLIGTLDREPVYVEFPNGDRTKIWLCKTMAKDYRKEDNAIAYYLILNPIFCSRVAKNFLELPQDIAKRISSTTNRKTAAHYILLRLLAQQDKRKPYIRAIEGLIIELGLEDVFRKNRGRTEKQILALFNDMKGVGIITDFETEEKLIRNRKALSKVTFILNREFIPRRSGMDEAPLDEPSTDENN